MDIIFFGSDNFAVRPLEALRASGNRILCVVTQPDKRSGRGLGVSTTPVALSARVLGVELYQPADVNSPDSAAYLKRFNAELFVVVAYGQILSAQVLALPRQFAVNAHASLLPEYRGASPINRAIIDGKDITGVSIIKMTPRMDAGPLILQRRIGIDSEDTAASLEEKLSQLAAALLLETIGNIQNNDFRLTPQDESRVTVAPKLKKADGRINWQDPAQKIDQLVRGCIGWPGTFTTYRGKTLKIFSTEFLRRHKQGGRPGEISEVSKQGIVASCGTGALLIKELQLEGKKRMGAASFVSGSRISVGEILGRA